MPPLCLIVLKRDTTLAESLGLCPHDTVDELVHAVDAWIAGAITEAQMKSHRVAKVCASCRERMLKGEPLSAMWD